MVDAVLGWLAGPRRRAQADRATVAGRVRWCASQDGLGLWAATRLGRAGDPRARLLAGDLAAWQWPDGGWNCDRRPEAGHSSFHETHGPLRGLAVYSEATGDEAAGAAAQRAAGFLLVHRLCRSCRTGQVIHPEWAKLHWPPYWHYDVLVGLRSVAGAGLVGHPDATEALDLLAAARGGTAPGGPAAAATGGRPGDRVQAWRWGTCPPSPTPSSAEQAGGLLREVRDGGRDGRQL